MGLIELVAASFPYGTLIIYQYVVDVHRHFPRGYTMASLWLRLNLRRIPKNLRTI